MSNDFVVWIKENWRKVQLNNKPYEFSDSGKLCFIFKGKLDLYCSKINNNKIIGKKYFLSSFDNELIITGVSKNKSVFNFIFTPQESCTLFEININQLIKDATIPVNVKKELFEGINGFLFKIYTIINNYKNAQNPLIDYYIDNQPLKVDKDIAIVSSKNPIKWIILNNQDENIFYSNILINKEISKFFPITSISTFRVSGIKEIVSINDYNIVDNIHFWKSLEVFLSITREILQFEIKERKRINDEWLEKKYKEREKDFVNTIGYAKTILESKKEEQVFSKHNISSNIFFNICSIVAEFSGIKLVLPPNLEKSSNPIDEISRYSGVRYREIILEGKWYKKIGNIPLIGFISESNNTIAIIPRKGNKVIAYDLINNSSYEINNKNYLSVEKLAYTLYKPLPNKKLGLKDVIKYSFFMNKIDIRRLILSSFLITILAFVFPLITAILFESIIPNSQTRQLGFIAFALLMSAIGSLFFEFVKDIAILRLRGLVNNNLQSALWDRLLDLPVEFFRKYTSGDLAERSLSIIFIINSLSGYVISTLVSGIFSIFNFFLLFYFSPQLALITSFLVLLYFSVLFFLMRDQIGAEKEVHQLEGNNFGIILQLIKGIPTLKITGTELKAFIYWFKGFINLRDKTISLEKNKNIQRTVNSSFALFAITIIYFSLFKLSLEVSTGRFIAFNAVLGAFLFSIISLSNAMMSAINSFLIYDRFKPIIEELPENYGAKAAPVNIEGNIELQNIVFKYDENTPIILNNISIKIKKGEYIALVGPSGSGKSTIIRLLLGFNNPESGTIIYDGQDLKNIDLKLLRKQIGVVLQDGNLFGGDIFTNIIGSSTSLTLDDAWSAAKEAALDKDIEEMPMGMFTIINEDGGAFSGGQKQRLMIARALVHKPKILIFDEATSALDNRTQAIVTDSLDKLKVTRIVVAHRLSTIKNADRIIYLEMVKFLKKVTTITS